MEKSGFGSQKTWPTAEPTDPLGVSPLPRLTSRRVRASPPREERSTWRRLCPVLGVWLFLGVRKIPEVNFWYFWENPPRYFWCGSFWGNSPRGHWGDYSAEKSVSHSKPSWSSTILVADQYLQGQNVLHLKTCELWNLAVLGISKHETCEKHGETYGKECGAI
jgi:hypothetical protein